MNETNEKKTYKLKYRKVPKFGTRYVTTLHMPGHIGKMLEKLSKSHELSNSEWMRQTIEQIFEQEGLTLDEEPLEENQSSDEVNEASELDSKA